MGFLSRKRRTAAAQKNKKRGGIDQAEMERILTHTVNAYEQRHKFAMENSLTGPHETAAETLEITARSQPAAARASVLLVDNEDVDEQTNGLAP